MSHTGAVVSLLNQRQIPLSAREAAVARASGTQLSQCATGDGSLCLRVLGSQGKEQPVLELPAGAVASLVEVLEAMAEGRRVKVLAEDAELTSVEAAEVLRVSRPFLIKLLEAGSIAYRKVGKHRRVRLDDVMTYKKRIDRDREAVLDRLAAEAQESDMGYPIR